MRGKKKTTVQIIIQIFLMFLVLFQLFPLIVLLLNSFRTDIEIKNMPIGFPEHLEISNYIQTWVKGSYAVAFRNSIFHRCLRDHHCVDWCQSCSLWVSPVEYTR